MKTAIFHAMLVLFVTGSALWTLEISPGNANPTARVYVNPSSQTICLGDHFTINVSIADVSNLYACELKLYYASTVMNGTQVTEGSFLQSGGNTVFNVLSFNDRYNSTHGILYIMGMLIGNVPGVNDSGVLATVRFKALTMVNSTLLHLEDVWLSDGGPVPISHEDFDGIAIVTQRARGIYIRADGSVDPLDAPISTFDNVTYVLNGNITSDADGIIVERDDIVIDGAGFLVEGTRALHSHGIYVHGRSNVTIQKLNVKNFFDGICLDSSSNNRISINKMTNNVQGIQLQNSSGNSISGNTIMNSRNDGIWLGNSSNNSIDRNVIMKSDRYGVALELSSNNKMTGSTIAHNGYGIELAKSSNNTIYHNNFNNTLQVLNDITPEYANSWDNGGNYWSNYNGTDLYHGQHQNETGSDGIGDSPYVINENNTDHYPLMNLYWKPSDINHDLKVDMKDVALSARAFGSPGGEFWNPHADITGPESARALLVPDGKVDMRDISLIAKHVPDQLPFVGSKYSDVYHYQSCGDASQINPENKMDFSSSENARNQSYRPCLTCNPP